MQTIAAKPSKSARGPEFQSLRGVFLVSQEGLGGFFTFPRLVEKNSCITYSKDYKRKKLCNTKVIILEIT